MLKTENKSKKNSIEIADSKVGVDKLKKISYASAIGCRTPHIPLPRTTKFFNRSTTKEKKNIWNRTNNIHKGSGVKEKQTLSFMTLNSTPKAVKGYIPTWTEHINAVNISNNYHNHTNKCTNNVIHANSNVKISHKYFGIVQAYAAITDQGRRDYNEDRVSVIYNISQSANYNWNNDMNQPWPKCSFFGIYDGHGGSTCADFWKDNLHKYIISDSHFPSNPQKAIVNGFVKAEKTFLNEYKDDYSGSCAIIVIIIENRCYIANVGDSRAILSGNNGSKTYALSRDHRPNDEKEYKRIIDAGGKIYQTEYENKIYTMNDKIIGPLRVFPGKLSVSRTIGDIRAKLPEYGGNSRVIISTPDIKYFDINENADYILIGCDGIFENMKNKEINDFAWGWIRNDSHNHNNYPDVHNCTGVILESLVEEWLSRQSNDNLTMIIICFKHLEKLQFGGITEYYAAQTENIDPGKVKNGIMKWGNKKDMKEVINNAPRQPLSALWTKWVNNKTNINSMKRVIAAQVMGKK